MSNWVPKSAKPDRSEIGHYLGSLFDGELGGLQRRQGRIGVVSCGRTAQRSVPTSEAFGLHPWVLPPTQPHLSTSEVRRFLRKRQVGRDGPLGDPSLPGEHVRTAFGGVPLPEPKPFKWISVQRRHKAISVNKATAAE